MLADTFDAHRRRLDEVTAAVQDALGHAVDGVSAWSGVMLGTAVAGTLREWAVSGKLKSRFQ